MSDKNYIKLIAGHLAIGVLIFFFPFFAKIYAIGIVVIGMYFVLKNKNKHHEVLYAAAYIAGSEVFLRTTFGNPFHEYGKYFVLLFILLGIFYSGIPKKINPYWLYLLFLIPSILIAVNQLNFEIRKKIIFDILGPITLGVCALYTYKRKITAREINSVLLALGLPVIACCTFLFLAYPLHKTVIDNTESNFFLSGDYAPNQMSTALGLGTFAFFLRVLCVRTSNKILVLNSIIVCGLFYRGLLTFSRGGMMTEMLMTFVLLFVFYFSSNNRTSYQIKIGFTVLLFPLVFGLASWQTDGLLLKRYTDKNPSGLSKSHEKNGRQDMALEEIKLFQKNPLTGIGVGEIKEIRKTEYKTSISSHNEITRLLAEHGILGVASLLILLLFPALIYLKNKQNYYLLCFFAFWLLTINHSGMRTAAPSLLYALALFNLKFPEDSNSA